MRTNNTFPLLNYSKIPLNRRGGKDSFATGDSTVASEEHRIVSGDKKTKTSGTTLSPPNRHVQAWSRNSERAYCQQN